MWWYGNGVERIEALERDETKDGILGREVFDGDEMLEVTPSEEVDWPRFSSHDHDKGGGNGTSSAWGGVINLAHRPLRTRVGMGINRGNRNRGGPGFPQNGNGITAPRRQNSQRPTPPPAAITPISRADTSSAPSTVYNVRYHPVSSPTPPVRMPHMEGEGLEGLEEQKEMEMEIDGHRSPGEFQRDPFTQDVRSQTSQVVHSDPRWRNLINHFKRRRASLPKEVASAQAGEEPVDESELDSPLGFDHEQPSTQTRSNNNFFSLNRNRYSGSGTQPGDAPLPVTVIPARHRGQQTWSPQPQNRLLETVPFRHEQPRSGHSNLPVRVIPSQPQASAPWGDADLENGDGNYVLRYDPEAAALVHEHPNQLQEQPTLTSDRTSWTQTNISEADLQQDNEVQSSQHHTHDNTNS